MTLNELYRGVLTDEMVTKDELFIGPKGWVTEQPKGDFPPFDVRFNARLYLSFAFAGFKGVAPRFAIGFQFWNGETDGMPLCFWHAPELTGTGPGCAVLQLGPGCAGEYYEEGGYERSFFAISDKGGWGFIRMEVPAHDGLKGAPEISLFGENP